MKRHLYAPFVVLFATVLCCGQGKSVDGQTANQNLGQTTDTCFSTYVSGSGPTYFKWCVSQNGNIVSIESPQGFEHIRGSNIQEGYSLCDFFPDPPLQYWDFADGGNSGWNAPVIVQPNGPNTFPLTIQRRTTDGMFELDQNYSQNLTERTITIKMKVYETGCIGTCGAGVFVYRYSNVDADNASTNWFDQSSESAWGYNSGQPGLMLSALPPPKNYFSKRGYSDGAGAFPLSDGPPSFCNGDGTTGPFFGDGAIEVFQAFSENVTSPATVRFEYKRF